MGQTAASREGGPAKGALTTSDIDNTTAWHCAKPCTSSAAECDYLDPGPAANVGGGSFVSFISFR